MSVSLFADHEGFIDDIEVDKVGSFESILLSHMRSNHSDLMAKINKAGSFDAEISEGMRSAIEEIKKTGSW